MRFSLEANRPLNGTVKIDDKFWGPKLDTFFRVTLPDTFTKLEKDGTLENYQNLIDGHLNTHKACPWHDGLLLESIRGASDYIRRGECDETLIPRLEHYIDLIERAQLASGGGYLSTFTQLNRPDQRYGDNGGSILVQHDLYNNGCLFEAGVHYYLATGNIRLLECALRSANELSDTIGLPPKKWVVPGHQLPEYALLELYELLCDEPDLVDKVSVPVRPEAYRELAHFWIHGRGHHEHRTNHPQYMGEYSQDHVDISQQVQAVGHAVRAVLYYTGITRLAMLEGDRSLLADSLRLWNNVEQRKLHINGGIGATHFEEKFGEDYDLPNTAYLETCATAGLIFWARSLNQATGDARYFQTIERGLYNLMLSSVTLQGDNYFYRNPLTSDGNDHHWSWHTCPCCPPMIHKTFGMFDQFIYAQDDEGLFVNLYVGGEVRARFSWGEAVLKVTTELPWQGSYAIRICEATRPFALRMRVPEWAQQLAFTVNGAAISPTVCNGYALFDVAAGDIVAFTDRMEPQRMEAHPYVRADRGRVAIVRGPLVYCVEAVDNHGEADFTIAETPDFVLDEQPQLLGGITLIHGKMASGETFTAIPLYAWDNRLAGRMNVWLEQKGKADSWKTDGWNQKLYRVYSPSKIQ